MFTLIPYFFTAVTESRSLESSSRRKSYHELRHRSAASVVLSVVARIPEGCVATYGQVAQLAGLPGRARLVGRILADDHGTGALPWHRVINAQGKIALPKGSPGHVEQRRRLSREGLLFRGDRIDLRCFQWRAYDASPLLD